MKKFSILLLSIFLIATCPINEFKVVKVIDGDTFDIEEIGRIRLIGVDAYDSRSTRMIRKQSERTGYNQKKIKQLGVKATEFAKIILFGKCVILKKDYKDTGSFKRKLRQVEVENKDFGELLLKRELGNAYCGDQKVAMFQYYNQLSKFKCKNKK